MHYCPEHVKAMLRAPEYSDSRCLCHHYFSEMGKETFLLISVCDWDNSATVACSVPSAH